jgi:hypothetical protein
VGEKETEPFQFTFNGFLKVAFQGSRVTSDVGLILVRELDERLGLEGIIAAHLSDSRHGLNTQFRLPDLLRQSVYSRSAALPSTLHWFETELLTHEDNLVGLMAVNRDLIGQAETFDRADRIVLDMDSSKRAAPTTGTSSQSATTPCFCSTITATAWRRSCDRATSTAPTTGTRC